MDDDIAMSEGHEPSYPAPGSATSTPYPALVQTESATPQHWPSLPHGNFPTSTTSAGPSMADSARGYLSLARYFQIGRNAPSAPHAPSPDDGGNVGEDGAGDDEESDEDDGEGDGNEEDDQQAPDFSESPPAVESNAPAAQPQEEVWTSLPGVHHLPDDDFLEARTEDVWPHRLDPAAKHASDRARGSRPRGSRRGRKGWKWALKGTDHENMFQSPRITAEASGTRRRGRAGRPNRGGSRGRPRGRGGATGRKVEVDPGEAFKALQARATAAFLDNDLDKALELSLQAVTENPEVPAAHFLIDQVMTAQGRYEEALQAHWMAVMTSRNSEPWLAHGERLLELAGDNKTKDDYDAAFRCFSQALKLDKNNLEIRSRKVDLFIDMKSYKNAFRECRGILKLDPGDTDTLWKLAELLKVSSDKGETRAGREERTTRVIDAYRTAFHAWRGEPVFGDVEMQWAHVDMFIGLLEDTGTPPNDCIRELKQIARWLLGRGHEIFWESFNDDREYDVTSERRTQTEFFRNGMLSEDETRYGYGLPVWLRAKLGCARARMGFLYRDEALRHFNAMLDQPSAAEDNPETFMLTAECLSTLYWYQDAVKFYDAAKDQIHSDGARFSLGMGKCYKKLERVDDAEKAFRATLACDDDNMDARIELARLCAEAGRRDEAAEIARAITSKGRETIQRSEKALLARRVVKQVEMVRQGATVRQVERPAQRPLLPAPPGNAPMSRSDIVLQHLPTQQPGADEDGGEDGVQAFVVYEETRDDDSDDDDDETESLPASLGPQPLPAKPRKPKGKAAYKEEINQLREQRSRVQRSHEMVKKLWPSIEDDSDASQEPARQWMEHAEAMAKDFKNTKVFFPARQTDKFVGLLAGKNAETRQLINEMEILRKRMREAEEEDNDESEAVPSADDRTAGDFHDISFQEWHRIMADLALQYARVADQENCNSTVEALTRANVFRHDFALYNTTLALSIYCAILFNDRNRFLEASRQYLYQSGFRSPMAYQIFAAAGSIGHGESPFDGEGGKMQQWTQKLVKMQDMLVMDPDMRAKWEWGVDSLGNSKRQQQLGDVSDSLIPGLLTTYAHIVTSKRRVHSSTALAYLFRALALQPDEIVVNLSIATNCIVDAMRRTDRDHTGLGRQKTIQQGLGFFYRYYNARVATGRKGFVQEAEYNAARFWDLLGWVHLAAKGYEKVLKLSPQVREEAEREGDDGGEDLAREAAFALQKIFMAAENEDAARAIGEEWLVM